MAVWRAHVDTWGIVEVLGRGEHAGRVESILRQSGPDSYLLVVSQAALGEAAAVIMRRGPDAARLLDGMFALLSDYRVDPGSCMPPVDATILAIINELAWAVPELDMTDRIILAMALADPDSAFLITRDHALVNNPAIILYEKKMRADGRRNAVLRAVNPSETVPAP